MYKWRIWRIFQLGFFVVFLLSFSIVTHAAGSVMFQVEVLPGFAVSVPDQLVFESVSPGQTVQEDLEVTVWSNVGWELMVSATTGALGGDGSETLHGGLEVTDYNDSWRPILGVERTLRTSQPATDPAGEQFTVPFRFHGDYADTPGVYTMQVEFTVVPEI